MDVFFINPEPLFLVLNRPVAYRALPIHHAHSIARRRAHLEGTRRNRNGLKVWLLVAPSEGANLAGPGGATAPRVDGGGAPAV